MTIIRQALDTVLTRILQFLLAGAIMVRLVVVLVFEITTRSIRRGRFGAVTGFVVMTLFLILAIPVCFLFLLAMPPSRRTGREVRARKKV